MAGTAATGAVAPEPGQVRVRVAGEVLDGRRRRRVNG